MKKYLTIFLFFFAITSGVYAQANLKVYSVPCLMPDGSIQQVLLSTTETGKEEFVRIATENIMNISPVLLKKKWMSPGQSLLFMELPTVSESNAYRFLANELCDSCSAVKSISRTTGGLMMVRGRDDSIALLIVEWIPSLKKWSLTFVPNANPLGNTASFIAKIPVFS